MEISEEQKKIIEDDLPRRVVISGPGTGKTTIIINILEKLLAAGVDSNKIQILTFTKSNTSDFLKKIKENIKREKLPRVDNLHSFALQELCKNRQIHSNIADDSDEVLIKQDLKNLLNINIDRIKELFKKLFAGWENLNAEKKEWESTFSPDAPAFLGALREHQKIMQYVLRGELVYLYKNFLDTNVDYKPDIDFLIVDEYQDLNPCDQKVIQLIVERSGSKVFLAGDDDQSIYSFRNADPNGIKIEFLKKNYDGIEECKLKECFRCDKTILNLSQAVITQDYSRIPKVIEPKSKNDGLVKIYVFNDQNEEAQKLAKMTYFLINQKSLKPEDILILLRNDFRRCFSKLIIDEHKKLGLNIKYNDLQSSFKSEYGQFFLACIKLLVDENKSLAIRTIFEYTKRVGNEAYKNIYTKAKNDKSNFFGASNQIDNKLVQEFLLKMMTVAESNQGKNICEQLEGIKKIIPDYIKDGRDDVISDLNEILELNKEVSKLDEILKLIHGLTDNNEAVIDPTAINIMSMHKAKGLSSKVVIIPAMDDEIYNADCNDDEERRLLYVSLTRAKNILILSFCKKRFGQQSYSGAGSRGRTRTISRFLRDVILPLNVKIENGSNLFNK